MRDYALMVKILRSCAENSCEGCPIGGAEYTSKDCRKVHNDAADAIEELLARDVVPTDFHERCLQLEIRKRLELEKQMPHWISVEDELPESGERVLIMFEPFEDDENISIGWLTKSGFDCYDDSVYFFRSVTHWMPLPKAPKEVE